MKRWSIVFIAFSLLIFAMLPACGGSGDEKTPATIPTTTPSPTATLIQTPTATATSTTTPTTALTSPVKIGAIAPWSGPIAMTGLLADPIIKLVEQQVRDMGGILGGRDVKVVKYDSRGTVAEAVSGATKLLKDDKVSALVYGGASGADNIAVADFAESNHILYVDYSGLPNLADMKYTVTGTTNWDFWPPECEFTINVLKAKTVAILASDVTDSHDHVAGYLKGLEPAGIKTVYEQYTSVDTSDFSPYLTKIKYTNPDVLFIFYQASESGLSIAKQIMELGGWGNIEVICQSSAESAAKLPGAQGWYVYVLWIPGLSYPGAMKFEHDFQAMYGRMPNASQVYFYNPLWTAINAIALAGTDTDLVKIAQTARSGMLEWETPMGRAHYSANGSANLFNTATHIEDKKLVPLQVPEQ